MFGCDFYKSTSFADCRRGAIESYFIEHHLGHSRGKYFFEAGAVNGFHMSQTAYLENEFAWDGVLVEGHERMFKDMKDGQRIAQKRNFVLGDGTDAIFEAKTSGLLGHSQIQPKAINQDCYKCLTMTIEEVLQDVNAPKVIDYMVIDVENAWREVLSGIDFTRREIDFLAVEMKTENPRDRLGWINRLMANGMRFIHCLNNEDFIFVRA